jgi:hypothetical protein
MPRFSALLAAILIPVISGLLPEQRYHLNPDELNRVQLENPLSDSYLHTDHFFKAVHAGNSEFEYTITTDDIDTPLGKSFSELAAQVIHETTVTGNLFDGHQYFSLDNSETAANILAIDPLFIIDCNENKPAIGDYYVGTSGSTHPSVKLQSNNGAQKGFIFSRQVIQVLNVQDSSCKKVMTELVHPIQILDTKTVSQISFPYNHIYIPGERRLAENYFSSPNPPLLLCDDEKVTSKMGSIHKTGEDTKTVSGIPIHYAYALDLKGNECIDAEATAPGSINFNHARGTEAIRKNIDLGYGIKCTNCYSFIGASVLVVFNIFGGKMSTFAFQAKQEGGAGFNIELSIKDPTFSGSKFINLANAGKPISIPIVAGLTFDIGFGGAWATVKGSGSAKGSASLSSGYTLVEEDYIMYANSKWSAKHTLTKSNRIKPVYSVSGFKVSSVSLTAIVMLSAKITYSLGGSIPVVNVGAAIDFSSILTATLQYVKKGRQYKMAFLHLFPGEKATLLSAFSTPKGVTQRQLSDGSQTAMYSPGDKIRFHIRYEGLNPNERHELYFNIHNDKTQGTGYPVATSTFTTTKTGNGETAVEWTVPHDTKFMQKENEKPATYFSVHSSARLDRFYTPNRIKLLQKHNHKESSIIEFPHNGAVVPTDRHINIRWDKNGLKQFVHQPGTDGMGSQKTPLKVNLIIVAINSKGQRRAYELANHVFNNGIYKIQLSDILRSLGTHFFIVIHDAGEYNRIAWHDGTFTLAKTGANLRKNNETNSLIPAYIIPPFVEGSLPLWDYSNSSIIHYREHRMLAGPASCPNSAVSIMLQLEFGFDGFTVLGKQISIGNVRSSPFVIIPQTNICL